MSRTSSSRCSCFCGNRPAGYPDDGRCHTHAAQLRAEGVDIAIISRQLGHASSITTACYLDHLAPRALIEAMRNRSWTEV